MPGVCGIMLIDILSHWPHESDYRSVTDLLIVLDILIFPTVCSEIQSIHHIIEHSLWYCTNCRLISREDGNHRQSHITTTAVMFHHDSRFVEFNHHDFMMHGNKNNKSLPANPCPRYYTEPTLMSHSLSIDKPCYSGKFPSKVVRLVAGRHLVYGLEKYFNNICA